jgi:hypothetical protein
VHEQNKLHRANGDLQYLRAIAIDLNVNIIWFIDIIQLDCRGDSLKVSMKLINEYVIIA